MGEVALVLGGCGFLGSFIVEVLLGEIHKQKSSVSKIIVADVRKKETVIDDSQLENLRQRIVSYETIDIRNSAEVDQMCHGVDIVYHCASMVYVGTCVDKKLMYDINVVGTENVISACLKNAVSRLIYISTQDVVIGHEDHYHQKEPTSYPEDVIYGEYARTKQIAEKAVLAVNGTPHKKGSNVLYTSAVRPVVMYGERDPHDLPNVFNAAKSMPLITFGKRDAMMCFSYVGNVAYGAVLAGEQLKKNPSKIGAQPFTITDETPANNFFEIHRPFLEAKGLKLSSINIHWAIMLFFAILVEWFTTLLQPIVTIRIPFCRNIIYGMSYTHVFNSKHAEELLGYKPLFDYQTSFDRTMKYWKNK